MQKNNRFKELYISILILFVLSVIALIVIDMAHKSRSELPVLGQVPDFNFVERNGMAFGKDNMKGKINIVSSQIARDPARS